MGINVLVSLITTYRPSWRQLGARRRPYKYYGALKNGKQVKTDTMRPVNDSFFESPPNILLML